MYTKESKAVKSGGDTEPKRVVTSIFAGKAELKKSVGSNGFAGVSTVIEFPDNTTRLVASSTCPYTIPPLELL